MNTTKYLKHDATDSLESSHIAIFTTTRKSDSYCMILGYGFIEVT